MSLKDTLDSKKVEETLKKFPYYVGTVVVLNSDNARMPKIGDEFIPANAADIELLEYHASVGNVTKVTE